MAVVWVAPLSSTRPVERPFAKLVWDGEVKEVAAASEGLGFRSGLVTLCFPGPAHPRSANLSFWLMTHQWRKVPETRVSSSLSESQLLPLSPSFCPPSFYLVFVQCFVGTLRCGALLPQRLAQGSVQGRDFKK